MAGVRRRGRNGCKIYLGRSYSVSSPCSLSQKSQRTLTQFVSTLKFLPCAANTPEFPGKKEENEKETNMAAIQKEKQVRALCGRSLKLHDSTNLGSSSFTRGSLTRLDDEGKPCELISIFGNAVLLVPAGSAMSRSVTQVATVRMEFPQWAPLARICSDLRETVRSGSAQRGKNLPLGSSLEDQETS